MIRRRGRRNFPFIRVALIVFVVLLAIYIPLKIYVVRSEGRGAGPPAGTELSIFVTSQLMGYREPCG